MTCWPLRAWRGSCFCRPQSANGWPVHAGIATSAMLSAAFSVLLSSVIERRKSTGHRCYIVIQLMPCNMRGWAPVVEVV